MFCYVFVVANLLILRYIYDYRAAKAGLGCMEKEHEGGNNRTVNVVRVGEQKKAWLPCGQPGF